MNNKYIRGIFNVVLVFCIYYFIQYAVTTIFVIVNYDFYENHLLIVDTLMASILTAIFYYMYIKIKEEKKDNFKFSYLKYLVIALGVGGISSLIIEFSENYLQNISIIQDSIVNFNSTFDALESDAYIWSLLSIVIIGPIMEELLFRALVFNYLGIIKKGWFQIVISALLFAIWHHEPIQSMYTFSIGIIIAYVYYYTKSIYICMYIHILNNFLSTLPPIINTDPINTIINYVSIAMISITIERLYQLHKKAI